MAWFHALSGSIARAFGPAFWPCLVATSAVLGAALWGIWRLRPWALWAFPAALLLDTLLAFAVGELRLGVLALQGVLVLIVLSYRRAFSTGAQAP